MCSEPHIILVCINTIFKDVLTVECADINYDKKFGSNSTYVSLADVLHNLYCDFLYSRM